MRRNLGLENPGPPKPTCREDLNPLCCQLGYPPRVFLEIKNPGSESHPPGFVFMIAPGRVSFSKRGGNPANLLRLDA